ncbi:restriction endonuclease subunit S [Roseibium sp. FZY0029]|uniref:restriction endonuclease subunit S n=1 Tax=Roseibium sp. FZY0029 TaxID=3116647 RepID=UPI002EA71F66|nr:restriction endonuclease subunit S [Roseibium sp. FZY0029]
MRNSAWGWHPIGNLCAKIGSGATPRGGATVYREEGVAFIRSQNVYNGHFAYEGLARIDEKAADKLRNVTVEPGDILLNITGDSVARSCLVPNDILPARVNQHVAIIRPEPSRINSRFLSYFMVSPFMQKTMLSLSGAGGTRKAITKDMIERFLAPLPPVQVQSEIADILSAYDDLIENNRRRIALLEEAARLLYREWFVHFRFPGHEHVPITDGLPEGWDIHHLSDLCNPKDGIQTGPFGSQLHQSDYTETGVPVVMPRDLKGFRIENDGIARIPEELADKLGRHRMEVGDTVYGRRGDIGRRAFIGRRQDGFFCGTGCLRIRPISSLIDPRYLFDTLGTPQVAGFIANQAKGSTMPNLSAGALKKVPIPCAPIRLQKLYVEAVEPQFELMETLVEQNQKLAQARDLLLPRLMSGEIAV